MSEGAKTHTSSSADAAEIWKRWFETSSGMWSALLEGSGGIPADPYALYDVWLKGVGAALERMKAGAPGVMDFNEAWKQWLEAWRKGDPSGLAAPWLEMMEEAKNRMLAGGAMPADPLAWFMQWYEAASETWAKAAGDVIGSEQFMEAASQFLEGYTSVAGTLRRANEAYFSSLQLPTRSDIARVAGLVVALEEKVDRFEDAFDDFADVSARAATHDAGAPLEERLAGLERKLDALSAALGKIETAQERGKRLDRLEGKLDSVLAALAKSQTEERPGPVKPAEAARRTPRAKSARQPEGKGPLSE